MRINPDLRAELVKLREEGEGAAASIQKKLHSMAPVKVGRIWKLVGQDRLKVEGAGDVAIVVCAEGGLASKSEALNIIQKSRQVAASRSGVQQQEEGMREEGNIVQLLYKDYGTWLPLVCTGGAAERKVVVVDIASKVGKTKRQENCWRRCLLCFTSCGSQVEGKVGQHLVV